MRTFMPAPEQDAMRALNDAQIEQFIQDGFVKSSVPFPGLADEGRAILCVTCPAIRRSLKRDTAGIRLATMATSRSKAR